MSDTLWKVELKDDAFGKIHGDAAFRQAEWILPASLSQIYNENQDYRGAEQKYVKENLQLGLQESAFRDAAKGNAVAEEMHIVKKKLSTFHWDKNKRP